MRSRGRNAAVNGGAGVGRKLGAAIAQDLISELRTMGLPAVSSRGQPAPRPGDGLVFGAGRAYGEASGSETIEGAARLTAQEIAEKVRATAEKQGWI